MAEQEMAVEMRNISKYFNGICALHDVNLQIKKGTIHALLGENLSLIHISKAIARHEVLCTLDDILRESGKLLQESKGRFYMIHKPFRLAEIIIKMNQYKIEPKRIQFIHPYVDKEPTMVLIEGIKGGKSRVKIEPPVIMYK